MLMKSDYYEHLDSQPVITFTRTSNIRVAIDILQYVKIFLL